MTWEHASWVTASDLTDGSWRRSRGPTTGWSTTPDGPHLTGCAVAVARGELVALLSRSHRFERLVDRRALLEKLGRSSVEPEGKP